MDLSVREMQLEDVQLRIDYLHDAPDGLLLMGVENTRLPTREQWLTICTED